MNGSRDCTKIDINLSPNAVLPEHVKKTNGEDRTPLVRRWIKNVLAFAKEDTNRVTFALKVGLSMLLVSLFILISQPFEVFGTNIIWAILTVAIMFEYTVGATLNRGFNRAVGSLLAGIIAIVVIEIAVNSGHYTEPYIIGLSIFLVGAITSFMKLWPSLEPYEYGFRVTLFTYCLIIVSGYRMGNPIKTAMDRLYSIAIGAVVAVSVNVLVFPVWAGEQLHKELVNSFNSLAVSLEECVKKYFNDEGSEHTKFSKTVMDDFPDEPAFKKCRVTLNSSAIVESLATSAKWEPPHGRFGHFFHPWSEYVKVAAVLRYCAYEVMALHGFLHSETKAPLNLRLTFQKEILDVAIQAAELLRGLASDIDGMKHGLPLSRLKRVHGAADRLQRSIDLHSYLLTSYNSLYNHSSKSLSKALYLSLKDSQNSDAEPNSSDEALRAGTYHETTRKQQRRLYSWPSREVDEVEEDGQSGAAAAAPAAPDAEQIIPRMLAIESTAALSLATFTSLLIEFVARLDRLVDAVDELATRGKFKQETPP